MTVLRGRGQPGPGEVDQDEGKGYKTDKRRAGEAARQGICPTIKFLPGRASGRGRGISELGCGWGRVPAGALQWHLLITPSDRFHCVNTMHTRNTFLSAFRLPFSDSPTVYLS